MAIAGPLAPIGGVRFHVAPASPDSLRLLKVAYDYLERLPPQSVFAVCVGSSTAWGIATPVSDLDIGVIVSEGSPPFAEKFKVAGDFIDHCQWPWSAIENLTRDPLTNPVLSWGIAFVLPLYDPEERLAAIQRQLVPAITQGAGVRRWVKFFLDDASRLESHISKRLRADARADVSFLLFESVRRLADAVLHLVPGGHCGEWPDRLRRLAAETRSRWLFDNACAVIAPSGFDIRALSAAAERLACLHLATAAPPRGESVSCSPISASFWERKARYYAESEDPLSLLRVISKHLDCVDENLKAKENAGSPSRQLAAFRGERRGIWSLIRRAWPSDAASNRFSLAELGEYSSHVAGVLEKQLAQA